MNNFTEAYNILKEFKGQTYIHGMGVLPQIGAVSVKFGSNAVLIKDDFPGSERFVKTIKESLFDSNVKLLGEINGAKPNAPRDDLHRIAEELIAIDPDVIISFGGGSTIDVTKAAEVLRTLRGSIDDYFGIGMVSNQIAKQGKTLTPHIAVQSASSSGAHLTKYSNITDVATGQKKLIVDDAIIPKQSLFDYEVSIGAPASLTTDGALDGLAHSLEVLYGSFGKDEYERIENVAKVSIRLIVENLPIVLMDLRNNDGREALGLATDLGGYAIMLGGTNGGHLTSFSLVDILSHGRACAIMNPYYTVFFAPAIERPLRIVGEILRDAGFIRKDISQLIGRDLGIAIAEAINSFQKSIGFPTSLGEIEAFDDRHITRALEAAKDPQLKMKLQNMPIPITAEIVDEYMEPILLAAKTGNLSIIKNIE